jgi:hypothetical protein
LGVRKVLNEIERWRKVTILKRQQIALCIAGEHKRRVGELMGETEVKAGDVIVTIELPDEELTE